MNVHSHIPRERWSNLCLVFPALWRKEVLNWFYSPWSSVFRNERLCWPQDSKESSVIIQWYAVVSSVWEKFSRKTLHGWFVHLKWHQYLEQSQKSHPTEYMCCCIWLLCVCVCMLCYNTDLIPPSSHRNNNQPENASFCHSLCIYLYMHLFKYGQTAKVKIFTSYQ